MKKSIETAVRKKGRESIVITTQMRHLEPIRTYAPSHPLLASGDRKGESEGRQTSRNHVGSILWMRNEMNEPTARPTMVNPIDTSKRQYGTVLVYGSILEFAGGSVVQNAEIVVSSKAAYKKTKAGSIQRR